MLPWLYFVTVNDNQTRQSYNIFVDFITYILFIMNQLTTY